MGKGIVCLTVFFEGPFWVGVFERIEDNRLSVSKVTFGAEPKEHEVYEFILRHYCNTVRKQKPLISELHPT